MKNIDKKEINPKKTWWGKYVAAWAVIAWVLTLSSCKWSDTNESSKANDEKKITEQVQTKTSQVDDYSKYEKVDSTILWNSSMEKNMEKDEASAEKIVKTFHNLIAKYEMSWDSNDIENIIFKKGVEHKDENWTYILINGEKYYKWHEGINGRTYITLCTRSWDSKKEKPWKITQPDYEDSFYADSSYLWECEDWIPNWKGLIIHPHGYEYWEFRDWEFTWNWFEHEEAWAYDDATWYADYWNNEWEHIVKFHVYNGNGESYEKEDYGTLIFQWTYSQPETVKSHWGSYNYWDVIYDSCNGIVKFPDWGTFKWHNFRLINNYYEDQTKVIEWIWIYTNPNGKKEIRKYDKSWFVLVKDID